MAKEEPKNDLAEVQAILHQIRERKDLKFKANPYLRSTYTDFDGTEHPLDLRYYQIQGILHLSIMPRFLLGDDTGLGKCKSAESLIFTDSGLIPIGDLLPRYKKLREGFHPAPKGSPRIWTGTKYAPLKSVYNGGVKPRLRILTKAGYSTVCTYPHPIRCLENGVPVWKKSSEIKPGDVVLLSTHRCDPQHAVKVPRIIPTATDRYVMPDTITEDVATVMGAIVSEGSSVGRHVFEITQKHSESHALFREALERAFGWTGNVNNKQKDVRIIVTCKQIRDYLEVCGIVWKTSGHKEIPWSILRSPVPVQRAFLRALYEGDGSANKTCLSVEYCTKSRKLAEQLQVLLLTHGMFSVLSVKPIQGYGDFYVIRISGESARVFRDDIGFLTERKNAVLRSHSSDVNPNLDNIPQMGDALRRISRACLGRKIPQIPTMGMSLYRSTRHVVLGRRDLSKNKALELSDWVKERGIDDEGLAGLARDYHYTEVVSVEPLEPDHVLDLEIDDPDHSFVGNGFLCHNTIQTIGALTGIWTQDPTHKAVVLTTKSAVGQWVDEVEKFTTGVSAYICRGTPVARKKAVKQWLDDTGPAVLVIGYGSFRKDAKELIPHFNGITLVADEASAFKNDQSQIHQWIKYATTNVARFWALTATMIENHLMEGWALYSVIQPGLFGSRSHFMDTYCITQLQQIGARKIKTIVGYRPDGPSNFRKIVDPYFLGRPKHLVAKELPPLIRQRILVDLTERQQREYQDALAGLITVTREGEVQDVETTKLTALAYCQQIVNHPATLQLDGDVSDAALDALQDGESEKLEALIEMLTEGALQDARVIVFSRFRVMVDIIMHRLRREKIPATRITGSENEDQRTKNKADFQAGRARVICITTAARQGVNLQAASDLVFYDTPWSAGDFLQIVGRMIRIGSVHASVNAYHLAARNTVDERVLQVLSKKMVLLESVLGKRLKENGDTDDGDDNDNVALNDPATAQGLQTKSDLNELYDMLRQDAKAVSTTTSSPKTPKP